MRPHPKRLVRLLTVGSLLLSGLALAGCAAELPQTTFVTDGDSAREILSLFTIVFWIAVGVFVIVEGALLYSVLRYRRRPQDGIPLQIHGNTTIEIAWTIVPAIIVVGIATMTFRTQAVLLTEPTNPITINVTGHQWWWEFEYADYGFVTANEIHLPAGREIRFLLRSNDVIHSFWFPRLSGKTDVIPGHTNELVMRTDDRADRLLVRGQCAEFCGGTHAMMSMWAVVEPQGDFDAWVAQQQAAAPEPAGDQDLAAQGYELFATTGCIGCHAINGYPGAASRVGPDLTHIGSREHIVAGWLENTPENMRRWLRDPDGVKPGNRMAAVIRAGTLTDEQIDALTAYLESLQ
jgi:cytochrome c oxidase subunit II